MRLRALALLLALPLGAAAQAPEGFAGTWALSEEGGAVPIRVGQAPESASPLRGRGGAPGGGMDLPLEAIVDARRLVIADDGATLHVTYPSGRKRVLFGDGLERVLDDGDGPARTSGRRKGERVSVSSSWHDGRSLSETWELLSSPRRLVVSGKGSGREKARYTRTYLPAPPATPTPAPAPAAAGVPASATTPGTAAAPPAAPPAGLGACSVRPPKGTDRATLASLAKITEPEASRRSAAAIAPATAGSIISSDLELREGCLVWPMVLKVPEKKGAYEVLIDAGDGKVLATEFESY